MTRPCRWAVCSLVLAIAGGAGFAEGEAPSLESLGDWLAGYWSGRNGGTTMEEYWMPPSGGVMLGLHRDVFSNGRSFFEYLRIEQGPDGLVYKASPAGRAAVSFPMIALEERRVVFENPDHDFPQRIIYEIDDGGALHARIEGVQNGKEAATEWTWHLVPCGPESSVLGE